VGLIHIYTLKENVTASKNVSIIVTPTITLRADEIEEYGKFGAITESDGKDTLWISSGWAGDESGIVWSYNVRDGLSQSRARQVKSFLQKTFQHPFRDPEDDYETATVFARGQEPKVYLLNYGLKLI
jgi:hypothetical protein